MTEQQITEVQDRFRVEEPDYPFMWTRGFAEAYLNAKEEVRRRASLYATEKEK